MPTNGDHQKLLTQVIQKQMVILGPDITLTKARNVKGLTVADDGTVTAINGSPQELTQQLIEQFMELSGLIVKKTMEPLLASYPTLMTEQAAKQTPIQSPPPPPVQPPPAPTEPINQVPQQPITVENNTVNNNPNV